MALCRVTQLVLELRLQPPQVTCRDATVPKATSQGKDGTPRTQDISVSDFKHRTSLGTEMITFVEHVREGHRCRWDVPAVIR